MYLRSPTMTADKVSFKSHKPKIESVERLLKILSLLKERDKMALLNCENGVDMITSDTATILEYYLVSLKS